MSLRLSGCCALALWLSACSAPPITPADRDLPRPRGFSPSVKEAVDGKTLDGEFRVSSSDRNRDWPVESITYKRFRNPAERAIYLRRALGRYAVEEAQKRGLAVSLTKVRRVAQTTSPSTAGEWWARGIHSADLMSADRNRKLSLPEVVNDAIHHSHQIASFGDLPAIRGTAIQEAKGRFVPEFYAEASRKRENERATSPAIAAGAARAITDEDELEFGVRSRLITGGEVALSQRMTVTDTNRTAYVPAEQTSSVTTISLVQPLLRGSGVTHNDAPRRIANMDTQVAVEEFRRQSESHLMDVERAYWNLYVARAVYIQKDRLAARGGQLAGQVRARADIDADPVLISRTASMAAQWRADAVRAKSAVDNAEFRLAALVNAPRIGPSGVELVPSSAPKGALPALASQDALEQIFVNRPELQQAILQYEAALLREGMAANESLPELDLVLEASMTGGANGRNGAAAFRDRGNGAGHVVGLKFAVPLGFDERDARYKRRRLETIQQERQVLSVISTVLSEIDVSANEYIVACNDLVAQRAAQQAAQRDLNTLRNRWSDGVGEGQSVAILDALLNAYERVQLHEQAVTTARATREIAGANLARARGVLLQRWGLTPALRNDVRGEPTYKLTRTR